MKQIVRTPNVKPSGKWLLVLSICLVFWGSARGQSGAVLGFFFQSASGPDPNYFYVDLFMFAGANYVTNDMDYGTTNSMGSWTGANLRFTTPGVVATLANTSAISYTPETTQGFMGAPPTFMSAGGCYASEPCFNVSLTRANPGIDASATPLKIGQLAFNKATFPSGTQVSLRNTTTQACAIRESFWSNGANATMGRSEIGPQPSIVLPVILNGWSAMLSNCDVILSWQVAQEKGFSHFELEHSTNGQSFSSLGQISYLEGRHDFRYRHENGGNGAHFYRLKLIDADGRYSFSKILSITNRCDNSGDVLSLYPNPVYFGGGYNLQYESSRDGRATIVVTDGLGRAYETEAVSLKAGVNTFNRNTQSMAAGVYHVQLRADDNSWSSPVKKVVVQ
ncbi:MAG: T9SS type A sorting domain-containing protein [Taibaiella sp.]|jgi:hypothetical protein